MDMIDIELRNMYKRIIEGLLSIDNFSCNYFSKNENLRKVVSIFLQDSSYEQITDKKLLLNAVKEMSLDYTSDSAVLSNAEYENTEYINYIFCETYSLFSNLLSDDKKAIIFVDLCSNSILKKVFYDYKSPFLLEDFYKIIYFTLGFKKKKFKTSIEEAVQIGIASFNETEQVLNLTDKFSLELQRLYNIPSFEKYNLNDYKLIDFDNSNKISEHELLAFKGELVSSYLFSKFEDEKIRFWYASDLFECVKLLTFFQTNEINNQYIWLDNYETEPAEKELYIFTHKIKPTHSKLIISGAEVEEPFGKTPITVSLKDTNLENKVKRMFPQKLAELINYYLPQILSPDKKRDFVNDVHRFVKETDSEFVLNSLSEYFSLFNKCIKEEENRSKKEKTPQIITAITEEDFKKRYDIDENTLDSNPVISAEYARILSIYKKLIMPAEYLKADKKMFQELDTLLNQHPNLLDKNMLYAFLKNAILFSKNNIIRMSPLLLVGSPGCGKSLFCRQLCKIFNQDKSIFIPLGSGLGADALLGSTPDYKHAEHGKILGAIWESKNNSNCLNPIIILDEVDKACFSSNASDVNQDILPSLLQLLGDENILHFCDNFFDVPIKNFYPNFIATANSLESIPESLLDRFNIIKFRDYTHEELTDIIIPLQYETYKNEHNELVPANLETEEIEIIYKMSKGRTRQIQPSINKYLAALFDIEGQKHQLNSFEVDNLVESSKVNYNIKQIGFFK